MVRKAHPKSATVKQSGAVKTTKIVKFMLEKTTKGAVRFQEVDAKGKPIDVKAEGYDAAFIGNIYARKAGLNCGDDDAPKSVTATFVFE